MLVAFLVTLSYEFDGAGQPEERGKGMESEKKRKKGRRGREMGKKGMMGRYIIEKVRIGLGSKMGRKLKEREGKTGWD